MIQVRAEPVVQGLHVVSLLGEHDIGSSSEVRRTIAEQLDETHDVIVDLSESAFFDCAIVRVLLDARQDALRLGRALALVGPTRPVARRMLEIIGALDAWTVYDDRQRAIDAIIVGSKASAAIPASLSQPIA